MKKSEIKSLNDKELNLKVIELKNKLTDMKFQKATSALEKSHMLKFLRKDLARALTLLTQKNLSK